MSRPGRKPMNEKELTMWILRRLGSPQFEVELKPADLADAIEDAKDWYLAELGEVRTARISVNSSEIQYTVPEDVEAVLDVYFPGREDDISLVMTPYALAGETVPYDVYSVPESGGFYSNLYQVQQYVDTAKYVTSSDPAWEWDSVTRMLSLYPMSLSGECEITYSSTSVTVDQLPYKDFNLFKKFALASAKEKLGRVRSRFASYPGAQGESQQDGDTLREEAKEEIQEATEEIRALAKAGAGFLVG